MKLAEALMVIREHLEKTGADEQTMKAWEDLRDELAGLIGALLKIENFGK